ncbi:unnamed protein product [Gordionus sp. m RMFG-2023]
MGTKDIFAHRLTFFNDFKNSNDLYAAALKLYNLNNLSQLNTHHNTMSHSDIKSGKDMTNCESENIDESREISVGESIERAIHKCLGQQDTLESVNRGESLKYFSSNIQNSDLLVQHQQQESGNEILNLKKKKSKPTISSVGFEHIYKYPSSNITVYHDKRIPITDCNYDGHESNVKGLTSNGNAKTLSTAKELDDNPFLDLTYPNSFPFFCRTPNIVNYSPNNLTIDNGTHNFNLSHNEKEKTYYSLADRNDNINFISFSNNPNQVLSGFNYKYNEEFSAFATGLGTSHYNFIPLKNTSKPLNFFFPSLPFNNTNSFYNINSLNSSDIYNTTATTSQNFKTTLDGSNPTDNNILFNINLDNSTYNNPNNNNVEDKYLIHRDNNRPKIFQNYSESHLEAVDDHFKESLFKISNSNPTYTFSNDNPKLSITSHHVRNYQNGNKGVNSFTNNADKLQETYMNLLLPNFCNGKSNYLHENDVIDNKCNENVSKSNNCDKLLDSGYMMKYINNLLLSNTTLICPNNNNVPNFNTSLFANNNFSKSDNFNTPYLYNNPENNKIIHKLNNYSNNLSSFNNPYISCYNNTDIVNNNIFRNFFVHSNNIPNLSINQNEALPFMPSSLMAPHLLTHNFPLSFPYLPTLTPHHVPPFYMLNGITNHAQNNRLQQPKCNGIDKDQKQFIMDNKNERNHISNKIDQPLNLSHTNYSIGTHRLNKTPSKEIPKDASPSSAKSLITTLHSPLLMTDDLSKINNSFQSFIEKAVHSAFLCNDDHEHGYKDVKEGYKLVGKKIKKESFKPSTTKILNDDRKNTYPKSYTHQISYDKNSDPTISEIPCNNSEASKTKLESMEETSDQNDSLIIHKKLKLKHTWFHRYSNQAEEDFINTNANQTKILDKIELIDEYCDRNIGHIHNKTYNASEYNFASPDKTCLIPTLYSSTTPFGKGEILIKNKTTKNSNNNNNLNNSNEKRGRGRPRKDLGSISFTNFNPGGYLDMTTSNHEYNMQTFNTQIRGGDNELSAKVSELRVNKPHGTFSYASSDLISLTTCSYKNVELFPNSFNQKSFVNKHIHNDSNNLLTIKSVNDNTYETFLQKEICNNIIPKLPKCWECKLSSSQKLERPNIFCRFYAFRKLKTNGKGGLSVAGFSETHEANSDDLRVWLPFPSSSLNMDNDNHLKNSESDALYLFKNVIPHFYNIIEAEALALQTFYDLCTSNRCLSSCLSNHSNVLPSTLTPCPVPLLNNLVYDLPLNPKGSGAIKSAWKNPVEFVREMCDVCQTTLFNRHLVCPRCGFSACLDCFLAKKTYENNHRQNLSSPSSSLTDINNYNNIFSVDNVTIDYTCSINDENLLRDDKILNFDNGTSIERDKDITSIDFKPDIMSVDKMHEIFPWPACTNKQSHETWKLMPTHIIPNIALTEIIQTCEKLSVKYNLKRSLSDENCFRKTSINGKISQPQSKFINGFCKKSFFDFSKLFFQQNFHNTTEKNDTNIDYAKNNSTNSNSSLRVLADVALKNTSYDISEKIPSDEHIDFSDSNIDSKKKSAVNYFQHLSPSNTLDDVITAVIEHNISHDPFEMQTQHYILEQTEGHKNITKLEKNKDITHNGSKEFSISSNLVDVGSDRDTEFPNFVKSSHIFYPDVSHSWLCHGSVLHLKHRHSPINTNTRVKTKNNEKHQNRCSDYNTLIKPARLNFDNDKNEKDQIHEINDYQLIVSCFNKNDKRTDLTTSKSTRLIDTTKFRENKEHNMDSSNNSIKGEDKLKSDHCNRYRLLELFRIAWKANKPVLVSGIHTSLDPSLWNPKWFLSAFGHCYNDIVDCRKNSLIKNLPARVFWEGFINPLKRLPDDDIMLKLKDWPGTDDFAEILPRHYADLTSSLPLPEYTTRDAIFNMAACLPKVFVKPDLGPKMYTAYGTTKYPKEGTTNLHMDISDATNVMAYVGVPNDSLNNQIPESELNDYFFDFSNEISDSDPDYGRVIDKRKNKKLFSRSVWRAIKDAGTDEATLERLKSGKFIPGAIWHVYEPKDVPRIREFLKKLSRENGNAEFLPHHDPIHDQEAYLNDECNKRLKLEYGVHGMVLIQCLGDAIFIPAGAPHQVRNLYSCIKIAEDFVSPEHLTSCLNLTDEFRKLSDNHSNHEDKLQIKNIIYHTIKDVCSILNQ